MIFWFGQNNQMIHIFIGLLACQYHRSTNVQIRRLKTTIQSALSHSVGLAIGSYIASVAVILMYVYIYIITAVTKCWPETVWLFASEKGEATWIWSPNQTMLNWVGFPKWQNINSFPTYMPIIIFQHESINQDGRPL
jgi:hypothetical protein